MNKYKNYIKQIVLRAFKQMIIENLYRLKKTL